MKRILFFLFAAFMVYGCNGLFDSPVIKITIKGQINRSDKVPGMRAHSSAAQNLSLADAKKVLIFYGNEYDLVTINTDGTFSGTAPLGKAAVIVFLTDNNRFIGNLFVGGMNLLPLVGLGDKTSIDLSTLTLDGTRVIPANDPVGSTIKLTPQEINFMCEVGAYYEALAENIDTNNDGQPDILSKNNIQINSIVNVYVGSWGLDSTQPKLLSPNEFTIDYGLRIFGQKQTNINLDYIQLAGPANNPYTDIKKWHTASTPDGGYIAVFQREHVAQSGPYGSSFLPYEDGVYVAKLNSTDQRTFHFSNVNMKNYMVIAIPTLHSNSDGLLTSISLQYKLPNDSVVEPRNLLTGKVRIQINNGTTQLYEADPIYGNDDVSNYNYYEKTINKSIRISDISQINLAYIDLLGNEYNFSWRK